MTIFQASQNLISILLKGKVIGGKYLKRWQVSNPKTGKMKWVYKYKPVSQRGAHQDTYIILPDKLESGLVVQPRMYLNIPGATQGTAVLYMLYNAGV